MMPPQGALSIERMCALAGVSRASYYRHWRRVAPRREQTDLRDVLQRLAVAHRHYGYRRLNALLRRRGAGWRRRARRRACRPAPSRAGRSPRRRAGSSARGRDGTDAVVVAVVHRLAAQQGGQHAQVLVVLRDAHGSLAHRAHRRVAGADAQVHAARRQPVQRRHRRHVHGRDPRAADGRARPQADPACLPCGQGQHGA